MDSWWLFGAWKLQKYQWCTIRVLGTLRRKNLFVTSLQRCRHWKHVVGDEQQQIWIFVTWYNWRFGKFGLCFLVMLWYWHGEVADSCGDHQRKAPDLRPRRRFSDPGDSSFQGAGDETCYSLQIAFLLIYATLSWCLFTKTGAVNFVTSKQLTTSFSSKSGESAQLFTKLLDGLGGA